MCLNLMFTGIFTIISRLLYCTYWWCKHCYLKCYQPVYIRGLYNVRYTTVRCTPDLFGASFISVRLKCIMFTFILYTVITRKLWNRKTTLFQYLSVFDVVTKQLNHWLSEICLFSLCTCCVPSSLFYRVSHETWQLMNSLESRLPITEFYGYDCRYTERPIILDYPRALTPKYAHNTIQ